MNKPQATKLKIAASLICLALLMLVSSVSAALVVTTDHQEGSDSHQTTVFSPSWIPNSTASLVNGLAPSSSTGSDFSRESETNGSFTGIFRSVNSLTTARSGWLDIATYPGPGGGTTTNNYVTAGGNTLIYTLPSPGTYGYNLTNITVFGGWGDGGRDALRFSVSYATVSDTNTFIPLTYVNYNPSVGSGSGSANRVIFNDSTGFTIAPNVAVVKFDFTDNFCGKWLLPA